jgi:hypothetical protein
MNASKMHIAKTTRWKVPATASHKTRQSEIVLIIRQQCRSSVGCVGPDSAMRLTNSVLSGQRRLRDTNSPSA